MDWLMPDIGMLLAQGLLYTIVLTAIITVSSLLVGLIVGSLRVSGRPLLSGAAAVYVEIFRASSEESYPGVIGQVSTAKNKWLLLEGFIWPCLRRREFESTRTDSALAGCGQPGANRYFVAVFTALETAA